MKAEYINPGLLYESAAQKLAQATVEDDRESVTRVGRLVRRHFREGTELRDELDSMRALTESGGMREGAATRLLSAVRDRVSQIDPARLKAQKAAAWNELQEAGVSYGRVGPHELAPWGVVELLFQEWRDARPDLKQLATLEDAAIHLLMTEAHVEEEATPEPVDPLVMKIMVEKFNGRYGPALNEEQRKLLSEYALGSGDTRSINNRLDMLRTETLDEIDAYLQGAQSDTLEVRKLRVIHQKLQEEVIDPQSEKVDEAQVVRFMGLAKLLEELRSDDGAEV